MTTLDLTDREVDEAIAHYREHGWARLGRLADETTLEALRTRADAIMLGEISYPGLFFQHDGETGQYDDLAYGKGWEGPSLRYRKIEKLEKDPLFWAWIQAPAFRKIATRIYGDAAVALYRALLMNKHAGGGSDLPWHQDGGTFWGLDRNPVMQLWTALDDAPEDGGCVEFVSRSHLRGLATPLGGVVPKDKVAEADAERHVTRVPARAGEVLLIHNHVWHRSLRSRSGHARRALSVCYMDGETKCLRKKRAPRTFVTVWPRLAAFSPSSAPRVSFQE